MHLFHDALVSFAERRGIRMNINISSEVLQYGVLIGFKLSRLEWIWGSKLNEVQKEFLPSKNEILSQLSLEDIQIDETNYKSFSQSILNYYLRTDIAMYSSILIGITIQRCVLVGTSKDNNLNSELIELAKSSLNSVPRKIVSDKESLFNEILKHKNEDLFEIINHIENLSNESEASSTKNIYVEYDVFISHANRDKEDLVEELYQSLRKLGINIFYDKESLEWGDNWKDRILNGTQKAKFAIIIISENFFDREWTERELSEFLNRQNKYGQKLILPIIHNITTEELKNKYPNVADIQAIDSKVTVHTSA